MGKSLRNFAKLLSWRLTVLLTDSFTNNVEEWFLPLMGNINFSTRIWAALQLSCVRQDRLGYALVTNNLEILVACNRKFLSFWYMSIKGWLGALLHISLLKSLD